MADHLKDAFTLDNLQRAWRWTRTNPEAMFKNYFRHIYRAYSLSAEDNLVDLRERLIKGTYHPTHATKLYFPKKSGILRPYSLLCIEDQVVYQALVNIVAEKLYPHVRKRYYNSVFGHLYAGKNSMYFYRRWQDGYRMFSNALRASFSEGYKDAASFDLTACYDSIDHAVLTHFLLNTGLEKEFCDYLCNHLRHWTASSSEKPIYQGHGIPQGPLPSGLLSECVLRYFDINNETSRQVRYFRYVDDIRLMAKSEKELRKKLIDIDMHSKEIGLFPQSSKIHIHRVINIEDEVKSISHPPELIISQPHADQDKVRKRLKELSPRYIVSNETRFKLVLSSALPNADISKRLLRIVDNQPHLYLSIFNYLSKSPKLSRSVSEHCMRLLQEKDLYPAFLASLLRAVNGRIHDTVKNQLYDYSCKKLREKNPELFCAAAGILLGTGNLTWPQTQKVLISNEWWVRTSLIEYLRKELIGDPSYEVLINRLLKDKVIDVAIVAADVAISENVTIQKPRHGLNRVAQRALKSAGMIGRIANSACPVEEATTASLGNKVKGIDWKSILGRQYNKMLQKVIRWKGYRQTDATAWVNIADTINDIVLSQLFPNDGSIGTYQLGKVGPATDPNSRFAIKYPLLFDAVRQIHEKRLESDLSHPITKSTGKTTRRIRHKEIPALEKALAKGYAEMWSKW